MQTYSIGQLARAADVPTSTVRFYERAGLLKPAARSGSNYRVYSEQSLDRLQFIRSALAERRLAEVRQKLEHLKTVERTLAKAMNGCCTDADGLCNRVTHLKNLCRPA